MTQTINSAPVDEPCRAYGGENTLSGKDAGGAWDVGA